MVASPDGNGDGEVVLPGVAMQEERQECEEPHLQCGALRPAELLEGLKQGVINGEGEAITAVGA
jgi:hypothetical protein